MTLQTNVLAARSYIITIKPFELIFYIFLIASRGGISNRYNMSKVA